MWSLVAAVAAVAGTAAGSAPIPRVTPEQRTPGHWIAKVEDSDAVIMTPREIRGINERIHKRGYRIHPCYEHEQVPGKRIRSYIHAQVRELRHWYKYDRDNRRMRDPEFSRLMSRNLDMDGIPRLVRVRYGLTVAETPVRVMPTSMLVQRRPDEPDFDILQSSVLEAGQPLAGYHLSRDREWIYVQAELCRGWVRTSDVGWASDKAVVERHLDPTRFLVVTGADITVYGDRRMRKKYGRMAMGATIPLIRRERSRFVVSVPRVSGAGVLRIGTGYIRRDAEVNEGFLEFTRRNVAVQAFKLLEVPYGWGGTENQLDCSRFVMNVYGTFGFELPRTSRLQVRSLRRTEFSKDADRRSRQFSSLPGLNALLEFPGHIGIYLGADGGRHYMIHSLGSYYLRDESGGDVEHRVKRVVVTDLDLGKGGRKGSLAESAKAAGVPR